MSRIIKVVRVLVLIGPEEWIDKMDALDQIHYERGTNFPLSSNLTAKEILRTREVLLDKEAV